MANNDISTIAPDNQPITLESGVVVDVLPLKTREFFKLIKIITNGAGPVLGRLDLFGGGMDGDEFAGQLIGLVIMAVPNAEDEAVEFIQAMVKPHGLIERTSGDLNKSDVDKNATLWQELWDATYNPEIEDTLTVIEAVVTREAADLQRLGKRVRKMLEVAQKTGQLKSKEQNSSEASHELSTSSAVNTDGQTTSSSDSPSVKSGRKSQPSQNGNRTKVETAAAL